MKRRIFGFLVAVMVFGLTACGFPKSEYDEMELTEEDIQLVENSPSPVTTSTNASKIETLSIYTVDSIEEQLVPVKLRMSSERITPEYIVEEVLRNLDEKVEVTEIRVEHDRIFVTFDDTCAPVAKCSATFETLILDCISNSLLDNIPYINEVVFRCPDGPYRSDNFSFGENEVYSSK